MKGVAVFKKKKKKEKQHNEKEAHTHMEKKWQKMKHAYYKCFVTLSPTKTNN